jgi:hypothetical protein
MKSIMKSKDKDRVGCTKWFQIALTSGAKASQGKPPYACHWSRMDAVGRWAVWNSLAAYRLRWLRLLLVSAGCQACKRTTARTSYSDCQKPHALHMSSPT